MKFSLIILSLLCSIYLLAEEQTSPSLTLILNMPNGQKILPPQFRTARDPYKTTMPILPSRFGLSDLQISGSGQFSDDALDQIILTLKKEKLLIVDLREESHGFINGNAVSWFADRNWANRGKTLAQIEKDEQDRLAQVYSETNVTVQKILMKSENGSIGSSEPIKMKVTLVQTEQELARKKKVDYVRLPVTDHLPPSDKAVEQFLTLVKGPFAQNWIHFHCSAGDGRTTTFMAMYDIYNNCRSVTFEDIIDRQWRIGGINLNNLPPVGSWKYAGIKERIKFLRQFYEYCMQMGSSSGETWTSWHQQKG